METIKAYRHLPGGSCLCVAWSNVLRHLGYEFSESDIYGFGSGYYFGYFAVARQKEFNIALISSELTNDFFQNTGIYAKPYYFSSDQEAIRRIRFNLDSGVPVALQVNPLFLEELKSANEEENWSHLPAHWVVVAGYDPDDRTVILYDNRQFNPIGMPISDFFLAISSGNSSQNPKRLFYELVFPEKLYSVEESAVLALQKIVLSYQENTKHLAVYNGSYGMSKFTRQFSCFRTGLSSEQIVQTANKIIVSLTGAGGIKGGYRFLFARFIGRLASVFESESLGEVSDSYKAAGRLWVDYGNALRQICEAPSDPEIFSYASEILAQLYEIENDNIQRLNAMLPKLRNAT